MFLLNPYIYGIGVAPSPPPTPTYDATVQAWADSMSATPSTTLLNALSTFVTDLKSDGIWTKFDRFYMHAAGDKQQATRDIVALADAEIIGSPTFSTTVGITTVPDSDYLATTYNPTTTATAYTRNSACIGLYINGSPAVGSIAGAGDIGQSQAFINIRKSAGGPSFRINDTTASNNTTPTVANSLVVVSRPASNIKNFFNGGSFVYSATTASAALQNSVFQIGAAGANTNTQPRTISLSFWGSSLTPAQVSTLNTRVGTLKTAIGF
jgi:hypothetical protein